MGCAIVRRLNRVLCVELVLEISGESHMSSKALLRVCGAIFCMSLAGWTASDARAQQAASPAKADAKPKTEGKTDAAKPAGAPQKPAAPAASAPGVVKFVALEHAQKAGVKTCSPMLGATLTALADAEQMGQSVWNVTAPDKRVFAAISYAGYPNQNAPRSFLFASATPTKPDQCDGAGLRVVPSALSCDQIAANLKEQKAPEPTMMGDVRVYTNSPALRTILLPTPTTGCVVMSSGVFYGK
jgi:hypothetical protein